jgi:hypothetical protein
MHPDQHRNFVITRVDHDNPHDWRDCQHCGGEVHIERWTLGYYFCMPCGEAAARQHKHVVQIPFSKGAYQFIYNPREELRITNPKPR